MKVSELFRHNLREIDLHHDEDLGHGGIVPIELNGEIREVPVYRAGENDTEIRTGFTYIPVDPNDQIDIYNQHLAFDPEHGE